MPEQTITQRVAEIRDVNSMRLCHYGQIDWLCDTIDALVKSQREAAAEAAAAIQFIECEAGWEGFRAEYGLNGGPDRANLFKTNADKLMAFVRKTGHGLKLLEQMDALVKSIEAMPCAPGCKSRRLPLTDKQQERWNEIKDMPVSFLNADGKLFRSMVLHITDNACNCHKAEALKAVNG